ncbi:hypothetical protein J437_LFUL010630 [Ladona fulva]|uniref:Uncharacterized protein n=1 Tax=Ladona fulva TaxID=123851 RepID=A0A8K0K946_LADFU|nr:hypothetical protein J437_LFUL010630 [Ladona fulva]
MNLAHGPELFKYFVMLSRYHGEYRSFWAEETASIIKSSGGRSFAYKCDISNKEDIYRTAKKVKEEVGTTAKAFLPDMMNDNHGHIVTIASLAGLVGVNQLADYSASKFAVVGFDEAMRLELEVNGINGVHTTVVCPYYINTGMFEGVKSRLFPILEPDYVAEKIVTSILTNDKYLIIPSYLKIFVALKYILPRQAILYAATTLTQVTSSMSTFEGRNGTKKGQ